MAAPIPVNSPDRRPLLSVRCTQSIPIGPMGADKITPMEIQLTIMDMMVAKVLLDSLFLLLDRGINRCFSTKQISTAAKLHKN